MTSPVGKALFSRLTCPQYRNQFLPKDVKIVGYARTKMDHDEYIRRIKSYIKTPTKETEQQLEEFAGLCTYVSGQYDKDESFQGLEQHLQEVEQGRPENHRLFYMALPPSVFTIVSQHLKKICYPKNGVARVIVCENTLIMIKVGLTIPAGREALRQGPCQLPRASKVTRA